MTIDRMTELERRLAGEPSSGFVDHELDDLASAAAQLRTRLRPPAPGAPTRARVWNRIAADLRHAHRPQRRRMAFRPAFALAGIAIAFLLMSGTTAALAAEQSLPGDALYPLKRTLETAQLALSLTEAGDEGLIAAHADRRLAEIEALSARGRWHDVDAALSAYMDGIDRLEGIEAAEAEIRLTHHLQVLERVRSQAPDSALPGLTRALERASRDKDEARDRRHEDGTPPGSPGNEKKDGEEDRGPEERGDRHPGGLPPGWERKLTPTP